MPNDMALCNTRGMSEGGSCDRVRACERASPLVRIVSFSRQESRVTAYTDVIIVSLHICSRGSPANMSYKNLSIGKKIAVVFAVIAAINVIFGLFLASELRGVRDRVLNFTDSTLPSVISVENLLYDVSYVRRAQFALLMVEDAADQQARRGRIQESVAKVERDQVADYAHRKGMGRALLAELLATLERAGVRKVMAVIGDSANAGSIGVHKALGFETVGVVQSCGWKFDRWLDIVLMEKSLGEGDSTRPE